MPIRCPHCRADLPSTDDAFCAQCREPLESEYESASPRALPSETSRRAAALAVVFFLLFSGSLILILKAFQAASSPDEYWTVTTTNDLLGNVLIYDEAGSYCVFHAGLVLERGEERVTLVYSRWPDNRTQPRPGDRVLITTELGRVRKSSWAAHGYPLEEVGFEIISRESGRF